MNSAGIIATVAGKGIAGYMGDGGPAVAAALNNPARVGVAPWGDLLISDSKNNALRQVTKSLDDHQHQ